MNRDKIDAGIDRAAAEAKETVDLLSDRIDAATRCAREKHAQAKHRLKETILHATDTIEEGVTKTADRIREKVRQE
ncbi:MAG TPA: hypothetical protein H9879_02350 [Candidatus Alistipes intestinipullorum]|nr:hypothetical protein [Candidatus Alistipes intestinipullorum]